MDPRDGLIGKVQSGEMTPDEAEAEAKRLGVKPLTFEPDPKDFDPMRQTFWTLPMAVAWIAYRTPDAVRQWWQDYRAQCRHWLYMDRWKGDGQSGYLLVPWSKASLAGLRLSDHHDMRPDRDTEYTMTVKDAADALFAALESGWFEAVARDVETSRSYAIQTLQWRDLVIVEDWDGEAVRTRMGEGQGPVKFIDIVVPSGAVRDYWCTRPPPREPMRMPDLWPMDRGGYMPLFCAAQWIATKGGAVTFDPEDIERWKPAYADLLARVSSGDVGVTGMRNGMREPIPPYHFADVGISYPFEGTSAEIILSNDIYLLSYAYGGEEHWKSGFDDSLRIRNATQWSRILVLCADVLKHWAFDDDTLWRSGAPGRPSAAHLVELEFERRCNSGEVLERLKMEAESLEAWLKDTHRTAPPLGRNRIESVIRQRYNAYRQPQK